MRILIATGIYPPTIGGPAQYAAELRRAFEASGHSVSVLTYGRIERVLPFGLRHLYVFIRALVMVPKADLVLALDTISAGLPATLAAKLFGVKSIVRIGGDFLWETYVERTKQPLTLPDFYAHLEFLSMKEKLIFHLQKYLLRIVRVVVFSTDWQRQLWEQPYGLSGKYCHVVENAYTLTPEADRTISPEKSERVFLWAGRTVTLKNLPLLTEAFKELRQEGYDVRLECVTGVSHEELMKSVRACYATILPSFSDVSPNFILDGIRVGKPFVMTKHTGISERIRGAGFFIDPLRKEDFKHAVISLCQGNVYGECQKAIRTLSYVHSYDEIAKEFIGVME